jgi:hypothetical protein
MRRHGPPLNGAKYCGNKSTMEVHDLDNEQVNCQINEIVRAGHAVPLHSLESAHILGYDNCAWCVGGSKR